MDLLVTLGILFLIIGVVLMLAGYLVPPVPPGAVSAGWGLVGLGLLLIIIGVVLRALEDGDLEAARVVLAVLRL